MVNAFFACRSFDAQKMGGNVLRELLELKRGLSETILIRLTLWDTLYQQISCQHHKSVETACMFRISEPRTVANIARSTRFIIHCALSSVPG
jgi:hypothetical protein